jgi:signal transduction histidine kinase
MLLAVPRSPAPSLAVVPARLPLPLTSGWEALDSDPPSADALDRFSWRAADPLREPGPRDGVRWYRIRLDLAACRGLPLAFYASGIRDVDEAYLDGVRIGSTGSFPPRPELATIQQRLYRLPGHLTDAGMVRTLAIRVYQGPSSTPVFRFAPQIDELALPRRRSWIDQALTALAAVGLGLTVAFLLFHRIARQARVHLLFAAFSATFVVYLLSGHSLWIEARPTLAHRIVMVTAPLLCVLYYSAGWRLLDRAPPGRFSVYTVAFLAYALAGGVVPDLRFLVVPTRLVRALTLVCLADLLLCTVKAVRARRPRARAVLGGQIVFALATGWINLTLLRDPWFYMLLALAAGLVLLAFALYSLGSQLVEERTAAVVAERGRMAREIHDNLAQGLVAISLQLESVQATLESAPEAARTHTEKAQALVRSSLAEARRSVWNLRPSVLEGQVLASALAQTARRLTSADRPRVKLETRGQPSALPPAVERNAFQIGKEAITNAVRHAGASRVRVRVSFAQGELLLAVQDDGRGFDTEGQSWRQRDHFGLLGMSERATEAGGRLTIASRPGAGTTVTAVFPLPAGPTPDTSKLDAQAVRPRHRLRELLGARP